MALDLSDRHPATQEVMQWFDYRHLKTPMREFSQQCHDLAVNMVRDLPDSPELTVGLRKLLEAKDCFTRASLSINQYDDSGESQDG